MNALSATFRTGGIAFFVLFFCNAAVNAQDDRQKEIPAVDQKTSQSFETATFGLG